MGRGLDPALTDKSPNVADHQGMAALPLQGTSPDQSGRRYSPRTRVRFPLSAARSPTTTRFHPVSCCTNRQNLRPPETITLSNTETNTISHILVPLYRNFSFFVP